jgi:cytochrome b6-f complex iron-sulfur subunit/menaquinol-cytochrome c reductase iron-sulfur subunit
MTEPTQKEAGAGAHAGVQGEGPPAEERRGALRTLVTLGSLAYVGSLVAPAARFIAGPGSAAGPTGRARWIRLGRLDDLPQGEPRRLLVVGDERDAFTLVRDQMLGSVWVVREGDKVRAMSATCPHLGCAVDLGEDKKSFGCPCHTSRFALSGAAEAGPSPRGMDALETRVQDGWVEVDFRRFRQGVAEREEVGG